MPARNVDRPTVDARVRPWSSWRGDRKRIQTAASIGAENTAVQRPLYWKAMAYRYRPEVLDALVRHGIVPLGTTAPLFVRDQLNDLYRFEIRRLRTRLLRGEFPKADYIGRVIDLRGKYLLLSIPVEEWLLSELQQQ